MSEEDKEQKKSESTEETKEELNVDSQKKSKLPLKGRTVLEQSIVNISCRSKRNTNCTGGRALMTIDPRNRSSVHYKCEECHGAWTIAKGDAFTY